jgi:hypothetical protein
MRRSEIRRALVAGWLVWRNSCAVDRYFALPPAEQRRYVDLVLELTGSKPDGRKMTEAQAVAITNVCLHFDAEETNELVFGLLNSGNDRELTPPKLEIDRDFVPADSPMGPNIHAFLHFIEGELRDPAVFMVLPLDDYRRMFQNTPEFDAIKGPWRKRSPKAGSELAGKAVHHASA